MKDMVVDLRGNINTLDPKSKLIITTLMVTGVAISIEPFQVLFFGLLSIPLIILYKPRPSFIKKLLITFPWLITVITVFALTVKEPVTIHLFYFSRPYTPMQFSQLVAFRFVISALHTSILIESEESMMSIIEALSSLGISQNLVTILLLINRIATSINIQYRKKLLAARTRGALQLNKRSSISFKLQILGRILANTMNYSDNTADTLTARGFDGQFTSTIRSWTSDGLALLAVMTTLWAIALATPLLR